MTDSDPSSNDLFSSLGGSLMKDLLADLVVGEDDGDWLNLEQLEQELRRLDGSHLNITGVDSSKDNAPIQLSPCGLQIVDNMVGVGPPTSAAGWLIQGNNSHVASSFATSNGSSQSHAVLLAAEFAGNPSASTTITATTAVQSYPGSTSQSSMDAWNYSLQKFTSSSLEEDFLLADLQRKKINQQPQSILSSPLAAGGGTGISTTGFGPVSGYDFSSAEDYDLSENPMAPLLVPPGLSIQQQQLPVSISPGVDIIDYNSIKEKIQEVGGEDKIATEADIKLPLPPVPGPTASIEIPKPLPPTPHNSIAYSDGIIFSLRGIEEENLTAIDDETVAIDSGCFYPSFLPAPTPLPLSLQQHHDQQRQLQGATSTPVVMGMPPPPHLHHHIPRVPMAVPLDVSTHHLPSGGGTLPGWQQQQVPPMMMHNMHHARTFLANIPEPPPQIQQQDKQQQSIPPRFSVPGIPQPHQSIPTPRQKILFCDPHYDAPPIAASMIFSRYMRQKDITYVVYAILKSILLSNQQQDINERYDVQYFHRHVLRGRGNTPVSTISSHTPLSGLSSNKNSSSKRRDDSPGEKLASGGGATFDGVGNGDDTLIVPKSELESRHQKAKEWSQTHSVLGYHVKSDASRPRPVIVIAPDESPASSSEDDENGSNKTENDRQSRAALWKSRIYVDQAHQALSAVLDAWRQTATTPIIPGGEEGSGTRENGHPTSIASAIQPHLLKLLKCLGISGSTVTTIGTTVVKYNVDPIAVQLLLKLPKGKNLLSRLLELALLPPAVVEQLLPTVVAALFQPTSPSTSTATTTTSLDQMYAEDRLLSSLTMVIQTLPNLTSPTILECCNAIINSIINRPATSTSSTPPTATDVLSSTARMQCTHALLHRGSVLASLSASPSGGAIAVVSRNVGTDGTADDDYLTQWKAMEQNFFQILSAM